MSKKRIATLLSLVFLLAACSSWSSSPMCEAPPVSQGCGHPTDWIALSAPTGEMQVLHEDYRAIIYVNTGAREGLPKSDAPLDEAWETIKLARSGDMAVYDKIQECFITEVGVVDTTRCGTRCARSTGIGVMMRERGLLAYGSLTVLQSSSGLSTLLTE